MLNTFKHHTIYLTIKNIKDKYKASIKELCEIAGIARSAYYKWLEKYKDGVIQTFNHKLIEYIKSFYYATNGILGYRQMTIKIRRECGFLVNKKRVLRLMRILKIKSVCRKKKRSYIRSTPQVIAENVLNREFTSSRFGEKWLTDVTEFKYGNSHKAYLSAILDLADKSIVSFSLGSSNSNELVFKNFNDAHLKYPNAKPIFHSDRGFQYTSKTFKTMLNKAGMTQSMSRVARCIDNGPMEAFWGMLKSEMYYLRKFHTFEELKEAVTEYIDYYNNHRYQARLNCMTPLEYREYLNSLSV